MSDWFLDQKSTISRPFFPGNSSFVDQKRLNLSKLTIKEIPLVKKCPIYFWIQNRPFQGHSRASVSTYLSTTYVHVLKYMYLTVYLSTCI